LTGSGATHFSFRIVWVDLDFPAPSLDGTCNGNPSLVSFGGLGRPSPPVLGGGGPVMPATKSRLLGVGVASLVAAPFDPRAVSYATAPVDGLSVESLDAAEFLRRAVRGAKTPPLLARLVRPIWLQRLISAPCSIQTPSPLGMFSASLVAAAISVALSNFIHIVLQTFALSDTRCAWAGGTFSAVLERFLQPIQALGW
jgi:hypothetical protein